MSVRVPIVLFVIAALLLGYILAFERGRPGRSEITARSGFLVERFVRERVTRVRIAAGDDRVAIRREGEGFDETWVVEAPFEAPGDPEAIEDYVRSWEFAVPVRILQSPSAEDRVAFGVDEPRAEVTFEMGPSTVRVSLGSGSPVDGGGYVRVDDGEAVMVVGKDVVALFDRSADSFALTGDAGAPLLEDLVEADAGDDAR